jgi:hypothetical protein
VEKDTSADVSGVEAGEVTRYNTRGEQDNTLTPVSFANQRRGARGHRPGAKIATMKSETRRLNKLTDTSHNLAKRYRLSEAALAPRSKDRLALRTAYLSEIDAT